MTTKTLTVDERRITLRDDTDVSVLAEEIVAAVRDGGEFVRVRDAHGQSFAVLLTPHSRVMIAQSESTVDMTSSDSGWSPSLELDF
ncbi:MAG: hypothetical protein RJQ01_11850 [Microcella sp.]|uniref:hypothetical protein n=1 Tax=Microcella sp. TaxID=1913979 RepID=UPI003315032D